MAGQIEIKSINLMVLLVLAMNFFTLYSTDFRINLFPGTILHSPSLSPSFLPFGHDNVPFFTFFLLHLLISLTLLYIDFFSHFLSPAREFDQIIFLPSIDMLLFLLLLVCHKILFFPSAGRWFRQLHQV